MKKKKQLVKFFTILTLSLTGLSACDKYDDSEIWNAVTQLQERVQKLEDVCKHTNANISSMQNILSALEQKTTITSVSPMEDGKGYNIVFSDGKAIQLFHGKNGQDGQNGQDGTPGQDGTDGKDGTSSIIGIKDVGNNNYVWTLNGEILKDKTGKPIPVRGKDGADGQNGQDAPAPQLKTGFELSQQGITGQWNKSAVYLSVDGGKTWTQISIEQPAPLFTSVNLTETGWVIFTLNDGSSFKIPRSDQMLDLLYGTWYIAKKEADWKETITFNRDNTYAYSHYNYSGTLTEKKGVYEFLEQSNSIILYTYDYNNNLKPTDRMSVLSVNTERLFIDSSQIQTVLYKTIPQVVSVTEISAPEEGGVFNIELKTTEEIVIEKGPISENVSPSTGIYDIPSPKSHIDFSYKIEAGHIVFTVKPATGVQMISTKVYITDKKGYYLGQIQIGQNGVSSIIQQPSITQQGITECKKILEYTKYAFNEYANLGNWYTQLIPNSSMNAPLPADNSIIAQSWSKIYGSIANINHLHWYSENSLPNGPLSAPLLLVRAFHYYHLAVLWGNVPYVPQYGTYDNKQLSTDRLFEQLVPVITDAINTLEEKKNVNNSLPESIMFSKDVARMLLAKINMYQGKYQDAKLLLEKIQGNAYYQLETASDYSSPTNKEIIWSIDDKVILNYTDVLLALAECEHYTQGNGMILLNQVKEKKNISCSSNDFLTSLKEVYKATQLTQGEYFAFLKRNKLAMSELKLTSENYLLLPIPARELFLSANLIQNPGY